MTTEQRYHTEIVDGVETKVWHTVTICTVTLKNKNLSHAPVYTMSREKVRLPQNPRKSPLAERSRKRTSRW